jgi:hypothetical protein
MRTQVYLPPIGTHYIGESPTEVYVSYHGIKSPLPNVGWGLYGWGKDDLNSNNLAASLLADFLERNRVMASRVIQQEVAAVVTPVGWGTPVDSRVPDLAPAFARDVLQYIPKEAIWVITYEMISHFVIARTF